MKTILFSLVLIAWSAALPAQEAFSSLEERMTGKEFMASGLNKLTDEELRALNEWLRDHSVATLEDATGQQQVLSSTGQDVRGFEVKAMREFDDSTVESRILGTFSGWQGGDVFKLENGMVWKQIETSTFSISPVENPVVIVKKGLFNTWRLSVEGFNKSVKVERIQ